MSDNLKNLIDKKHELDKSKKEINNELSKIKSQINSITRYKDTISNNINLFEDLKTLIDMQQAFTYKAYPVIKAMCNYNCNYFTVNKRLEMTIKDEICPFACICEYIQNGATDTAKEGVNKIVAENKVYRYK